MQMSIDSIVGPDIKRVFTLQPSIRDTPLIICLQACCDTDDVTVANITVIP